MSEEITQVRETFTKYPDPRLGLPSASNALADHLCQGRHLMQAGLPEPEESEDASFGTAVHAALCDDKVIPTLTQEQLVTYEKAKKHEDTMLAGWPHSKGATCIREKRFWRNTLHADGTSSPLISGQVDALWVSACGKFALIEDVKSLWGNVEEADRNAQLRDLACLVYHAYPSLEEIQVFINQPAKPSSLVASFDPLTLTKASINMANRARNSMDAMSKRTPCTEACKHCRAKHCCPEALNVLQKATSFVGNIKAAAPSATEEEIKAGTTATIEKLSDADLERMAAIASYAEMIGKAVKEELRRRLENGIPFKDWSLEPGRKTEKIVEISLVWARCKDLGVPIDVFTRACTLTKEGLTMMIEQAISVSGKQLESAVKTIIEGATKSTQTKPILKHT